jgi:hypothetical protein
LDGVAVMENKKKPPYLEELQDAYDLQELIERSEDYQKIERFNQITGVAHDIAFAQTLVDSPRYKPYRDLLWQTFDFTVDTDGKVAPKALSTDFKRAIRSKHAQLLGCNEFVPEHFMRAFANDHVITVLMRYIVADEPEYFREYVQLNHADCDIILCRLDPKRFKWLFLERLNEAPPDSPWQEMKAEYDQLELW